MIKLLVFKNIFKKINFINFLYFYIEYVIKIIEFFIFMYIYMCNRYYVKYKKKKIDFDIYYFKSVKKC